MKAPEESGGGDGRAGALDALPEIDEGQPIRDAVIDMTEAGRAVLTHSTNTKRQWSKLNGVYNAPEEHLVLTAMDQPERDATGLKDDLRKAGSALTTYANECDRLRGVRSQLQIDINGFYADKVRIQTEHPEDGSHQTDLLNKENGLLDRVIKLQGALDAAQITCRNVLQDLWGGEHYEKVGNTHVYDTTVYGFTDDGYRELTKEGLTPWQPPSMWTDPHRSVLQLRADQGTTEAAQTSFFAVMGLTGKLGPGKAKAGWSGVWQTATDGFKGATGIIDPEASQRNMDRLKGLLRLNTFKHDPSGTMGGYRYDSAMLILSGGSGAIAQTAFKSALRSLAHPAKIADTSFPELEPRQTLHNPAGSSDPQGVPQVPLGSNSDSPAIARDPGIGAPTPMPVNAFPNHEAIKHFADRVPGAPDTYDAGMHGSPYSVQISTSGRDVVVDHRVLARYILSQPDYDGGPVRLLSCCTGATTDGIAQNLANKLGVPVEAPSHTLWIYPNGALDVGDTPGLSNGSWIKFFPGGGRP